MEPHFTAIPPGWHDGTDPALYISDCPQRKSPAEIHDAAHKAPRIPYVLRMQQHAGSGFIAHMTVAPVSNGLYRQSHVAIEIKTGTAVECVEAMLCYARML